MDELRKEEIQRTEESLAGYLKEQELQQRKLVALTKKKDLVVNNPRRLEPVFAYEKLDSFWEAQSELHMIAFEEEMHTTNKVLTTVTEMIPTLESSLQRLKGDE